MDIKEEMKLHQWARDMADQKSSGMTRKQWCEMKGISFSTYDLSRYNKVVMGRCLL